MLQEDKVPDWMGWFGNRHKKEAILHFRSAVQCPSMGEIQRKRQAETTLLLVSATLQDSLFCATRSLGCKELNRFHGRSNQHSLWNTLPVPSAKNIGGIGCASAVNVIQCLLVFGMEMEDFTIIFSPQTVEDDKQVEEVLVGTPGRPREKLVLHMPDSQDCNDWKDELR